jgi:hypothetical protein
VNKAVPDPAMLKDIVKTAMRVWDAAKPAAPVRHGGKRAVRSRAKISSDT